MNRIGARRRSHRRLLEWTIFANAILAFQVGCSRPPDVNVPATFEVTGKVVDKSGKQVTHGMVEFVSLVDAKSQASGKLRPDGTFTLHTYVAESVVPGAVAGAQEVRFHPGVRGQEPYQFKGPFEVVAGKNHFELKYPYEAVVK